MNPWFKLSPLVQIESLVQIKPLFPIKSLVQIESMVQIEFMVPIEPLVQIVPMFYLGEVHVSRVVLITGMHRCACWSTPGVHSLHSEREECKAVLCLCGGVPQVCY